MAKNIVIEANRTYRLAAIRKLEQLMQLAVSPGFAGSVSVELSAKDQRLLNIKSMVTEHSKPK